MLAAMVTFYLRGHFFDPPGPGMPVKVEEGQPASPQRPSSPPQPKTPPP